MPRTQINPITPIGSYPNLPLSAGAATVVPTAADVANMNMIPFGTAARLLVFVRSTDAGAQTVTVTSAKDPYNRAGDITTYSVAAGATAILGPFERAGWMQADQMLYLQATAATVTFVAVPI